MTGMRDFILLCVHVIVTMAPGRHGVSASGITSKPASRDHLKTGQL